MYEDLYQEKDNDIFGLLRPREYASSVFTIDIEGLYKKGIRGFIVDLDDTLIPRPENWSGSSFFPFPKKVAP